MKKVRAQEGQTIYDIALQEYNNVSAINALYKYNPHIDGLIELSAGTEILIPIAAPQPAPDASQNESFAYKPQPQTIVVEGTLKHDELQNRELAAQHPGTAISIDASAFNKNLATTDNTVQKVAAKVDQLQLGVSLFETHEGKTRMKTAQDLDMRAKKLVAVAAGTEPTHGVNKEQLDGKQNTIGFTPENVDNKKTSLTDDSDTFYPSQKAVKTAVDAKASGKALTVTLLAANWALNVQTLAVAGATGTNLLIITPKNNFTDRDNWANADIIPTAQGVDTVTFTCANVPIANIDVNVLILNNLT